MSLLQKVFLCWSIHKTVSTYKVYKENLLNVGNISHGNSKTGFTNHPVNAPILARDPHPP